MSGIFPKLFVIMLCVVLSDCGDTCTKNSCKTFQISKKNLNKRLIGHAILEPEVNDLHDCARHCFYYKLCKSFDFHRKERSCKLNNVTGDSPGAVFKDKAGAIFSDIGEWPKNMAGKCGNRPCFENQRCVHDKNNHLCIDITCGGHPIVQNGWTKLNPSDKYNDSASVYCHKGFHTDQKSVKCQLNGKWENTICEKKECGNVPTIENGEIVLRYPGKTLYQDLASVNCDAGYKPNKTIIHCQLSEKWEPASCVKIAESFRLPHHGK
ncbi:sushi, von Willebrand factor type A, EGF and pentraxin domain-containing protein 1-like [Mercenaria mercenaria]|uniref:sushi, von Willebrand factor type A, EGF and pentraxin domain-containing protein 1-like n=1 Tax=Mercenaria mercenaria TaxID=6596 RepID=UPI00234F9C1F|nr:sushi, von Willebrand factor type A, EGF and pentraxin domain-containing protein 1-like [Mercenaria mercenaria]